MKVTKTKNIETFIKNKDNGDINILILDNVWYDIYNVNNILYLVFKNEENDDIDVKVLVSKSDVLYYLTNEHGFITRIDGFTQPIISKEEVRVLIHNIVVSYKNRKNRVVKDNEDVNTYGEIDYDTVINLDLNDEKPITKTNNETTTIGDFISHIDHSDIYTLPIEKSGYTFISFDGALYVIYDEETSTRELPQSIIHIYDTLIAQSRVIKPGGYTNDQKPEYGLTRDEFNDIVFQTYSDVSPTTNRGTTLYVYDKNTLELNGVIVTNDLGDLNNDFIYSINKLDLNEGRYTGLKGVSEIGKLKRRLSLVAQDITIVKAALSKQYNILSRNQQFPYPNQRFPNEMFNPYSPQGRQFPFGEPTEHNNMN